MDAQHIKMAWSYRRLIEVPICLEKEGEVMLT